MDMVMEKENGNSAECGWNARMEAENRRRELLLEREATAHDPLTGKGNGEGWMRVNRAFIHKRVKNPAFRPEMAMEEGGVSAGAGGDGRRQGFGERGVACAMAEAAYAP